jgi:arabinose-5-phosphate isomerase
MSTEAVRQNESLGRFEQLRLAREIVRAEGQALMTLSDRLSDVMVRGPRSVPAGTMMPDAIRMLAERKISELPVVDQAGRPVGMIDITDVVAWLPGPTAASEPEETPIPDNGHRDDSSETGPDTVPFAR